STSDKSAEVHQINERIVQQVVDKVLNDTGQLIGHQNFLTKGVDGRVISELQIKALIKAPPEIAKIFRPKIDELFFKDYKSRFQVFEDLIYPSSISATNYFGAEYLHELLMTRVTSFDREIFWLGWDQWDIHELGETEKNNFYQFNLQNIIDPYGEELHLPEFSLHNEYPLIFGWALATLDQSFRERLRVALTEWALKDPQEYLLLLSKLFTGNDPQIHEDIGAITLGVASKLKDTESLALLAHWSLDNIFNSLSTHRNVIIRTGFRAIVEKAFSLGSITDVEVQKARPHPLKDFNAILTDRKALSVTSDEIYPIVHDLAWYVIKRGYDDFLEYASVDANVEYLKPSEIFLKKYLDELGLKHLNAYSWSISSAIAYMKSLGFSRVKGNTWTNATHGSKSKNFTLEEKYTWLAVHFLQGYLSDYVPLSNTDVFIDDYMKIVSIPNPAESLKALFHPASPNISDNWLIKEPLAPEMDGLGSINDQIKNAVENEPTITFEKWLEFKDRDFRVEGKDDEWLAVFNYTTVHDSKDYIYSSIDARGVIIDKGGVPALLNLLENHPRNSYFINHIDRMVASPDTDTYSNPSDIVWMSWIQEVNSKEKYYIVPEGIERELHYTVTSVTKNTVEGEREIYIPSKIVRGIMDITSMENELFLDKTDKLKGFNHILTLPNYDKQEMTLVLKTEFLDKLNEKNLEIVWFVDLYRSKNPLNDSIKSKQHPMKTRKYLVWYSEGKIESEKIWDERFSNQRDSEE
ncbi:MAG: hypothetical protein H7336_04120, partial [Bacteriovorax sp.]|nr:hypothetical protein [Bacteriovorax sp.]